LRHSVLAQVSAVRRGQTRPQSDNKVAYSLQSRDQTD